MSFWDCLRRSMLDLNGDEGAGERGFIFRHIHVEQGI